MKCLLIIDDSLEDHFTIYIIDFFFWWISQTSLSWADHYLLSVSFISYTLFWFVNASGSVYSPIDWPEEEWHENINTNLTGLWLVSKYVCRLMKDAKQKGSVINISSIGGIMRGQLPGGAAYSAAKAGVNAITKVWLVKYAKAYSYLSLIKPTSSNGYINLKVHSCFSWRQSLITHNTKSSVNDDWLSSYNWWSKVESWLANGS